MLNLNALRDIQKNLLFAFYIRLHTVLCQLFGRMEGRVAPVFE